MITATKIATNANPYMNMIFKHIARKIFHKNFLILGIILSVCTNALCGEALDRQLSLDDLHMVQAQLPENILPRWIKIGILLHVQPPFLNTIAEKCIGNYSETCTEMLRKWLTGCTMSNDMRKPTLRELAIAIGASCGGACPFTATKIFEQHGDGETYESALKNLREDAKTIDGQKNNDWAFVEHLIKIYFLSKENFSDINELGKRLSLAPAPYAALPVLFSGFYPCVTNPPALFPIGVSLCLSMSEINGIVPIISSMNTNKMSVVLFELLYYALKNHSARLKWSLIVKTIFLKSPNQPASNTMQQAIDQDSGV